MCSDAAVIGVVYAFVLLGGGCWFLLGVIATVVARLVHPLRQCFPILWRIWCGGSIGFIPALVYVLAVVFDVRFAHRMSPNDVP